MEEANESGQARVREQDAVRHQHGAPFAAMELARSRHPERQVDPFEYLDLAPRSILDSGSETRGSSSRASSPASRPASVGSLEDHANTAGRNRLPSPPMGNLNGGQGGMASPNLSRTTMSSRVHGMFKAFRGGISQASGATDGTALGTGLGTALLGSPHRPIPAKEVPGRGSWQNSAAALISTQAQQLDFLAQDFLAVQHASCLFAHQEQESAFILSHMRRAQHLQRVIRTGLITPVTSLLLKPQERRSVYVVLEVPENKHVNGCQKQKWDAAIKIDLVRFDKGYSTLTP